MKVELVWVNPIDKMKAPFLEEEPQTGTCYSFTDTPVVKWYGIHYLIIHNISFEMLMS